MTNQHWCLCGKLMDIVINAERGVRVGWYCKHCGRWEECDAG